METDKLVIKQLDKKLEGWRASTKWFHPKNGWVRTIRKALNMTTKQLAHRLCLSRSRIIRIEADEIDNRLTLRTLSEVAHALNCDFVYALVPKKPLCQLLEDQAHKAATQQLTDISHNMALEKQELLTEQNKEQLEELTKTLLKKQKKLLWSDKWNS